MIILELFDKIHHLFLNKSRKTGNKRKLPKFRSQRKKWFGGVHSLLEKMLPFSVQSVLPVVPAARPTSLDTFGSTMTPVQI